MGGSWAPVAIWGLCVRIGVITTIVLCLLAPLSIIAGLTPLTGAALMAVMTLTIGRLSRYGLHRAAILVPIFLAWPMLSPVPWVNRADLANVTDLLTKHGLTLTSALSKMHPSGGSSSSGVSSFMASAVIQERMNQTYLAWVVVFFFVGAVIPVIVLPLIMRKAKQPTLVPNSRAEAVPYTATITILVAGATYYFLNHPKQAAGGFLIAAVLVLTQVGGDIEWKLTLERVVGTVAGIALTIGMIALIGANSYVELAGIPIPGKLYLFGLLFGCAAIIVKFSPRLWIYYVLITPTAAMLNAYTTNQAAAIGWQRVGDNLAGAALVVVAALVTLAAGRLMKTDDASSTPAVAPPASPA